jgi:twitching motility two-component system response regulator PilH
MIGATPPGNGRFAHVLVIEDDLDIREMYSFLLEGEGIQIAKADHAQDGLALARELVPDVILTDIVMPGPLDVFTMTKLLRSGERTRHIPVIAVTGYDPATVHASGRFHRVLVKPIMPDDLLDAVRAVLARSAALKARVARLQMRMRAAERPPNVA